MRGGASRVTPASAGRGQGSGSTQERENETETEIEQHLAAQERELEAVVESMATVLGEVSELSAAVSQTREMLLHITDAINQDPQLAGPATAAQDQTVARSESSEMRFLLQRKTYTRHGSNVAPRYTRRCVRA